MKALKLKMYQETACYKKPFAFKVTETYPLPPYSTIIGMVHRVLHAKPGEYYPMEVSVQGSYESIFNSYNTTLFYKANNVTSMPLNVHMLLGVNLVIHIKATDEVINKIISGFKYSGEIFTLGRNEDFIRIDSVKEVNVKEVRLTSYNNSSVSLKNNFYIPKKYELNNNGITYKLNKKYEVVNNLRRWEKVETVYVENGERINKGLYYIDDDLDGEDLVFFG